ncbi:aminoglycoside phosphotransferase [Glycomyces paridis]|uniref:Aminoglycoside phosphotransferase n=1 Tax=Glycomyces paridis TaxID=2126555 RepID=A0A4S8P7N6_9ACTN|nr:aminoglycoside phosphotransferase [Glycomyces paridis]THV26248.1 aminoglycoside phosphotransferase [Glycomyces paridis]
MLDHPLHSPIGPPLTVGRPLAHNAGNQATGGIWRVAGPGGEAVLKHLTPAGEGYAHWPASTDLRDWNYWRREHLAYTTGFAAAYGREGGIGAPEILAEGERADGSIELWLEAVEGVHGRDWSIGDLADFARRLGAVQARPAAEQPWHSRRFLRRYAGRRDYPGVDWDHPVAAAHWPEDLRAGLADLWHRRSDLFDLAEALPQTIGHLDVWPMNLIRTDTGPVLLDWSFTGTGAIGEDVANLIADTFFDGLQPVERLAETETALTDAYIEGLGPAADGEAVRTAIAATGAAKYAWLAPAMLANLAQGRSTGSAHYDPGSSDALVLERRRPILAMLTRWARTAL